MTSDGLTRTAARAGATPVIIRHSKRGLGTEQILRGGILLLAVLAAMRFARDFFIPLTFAVVLNLLLSPVVRALKRIGIPPAMGGGIVLVILASSLIAAFSLLVTPASTWIARAPQTLSQLEGKLSRIIRPYLKIREATERVTKIASGETARTPEAKPPDTSSTDFLRTALSLTWETGASLILSVVLLYFLLAAGDLFLTKVVRLTPHFSDKKKAVELGRELEQKISHYLLFVMGINAGLGMCVGMCQWLLGMPNPALWGTMAFVVNFIPYLGGAVGISIVAVVSVLSFDDLGWALLPPLSYFACLFVEGNFITPHLLGRGMRLNPPVIFIWLMFWGCMWGIFGALLAVPMLVILKIYCDHLDSLSPLGEFLAD